MSLVLAPSPTPVPLLPSGTPASVPKLLAIGSTHGPVPTTAGPVSSWMDSMGKRLSGLLEKPETSVGRYRL